MKRASTRFKLGEALMFCNPRVRLTIFLLVDVPKQD